jgi:hypothetical protein
MSIRPRPTPSVILVDPGDEPIVTGSFYYYNASVYSCNRTSCGQFQGSAIVTAGVTPLTLGGFYTSPTILGRTYQVVSLASATTSSIVVNSNRFTNCSSACLTNVPAPSFLPSRTPSISVTPSITRTPSVTPTVTPTVTPSRTPNFTVSPTTTPTPSITITPTKTPTPSVTPYPSPTVGITVEVQWQILDTIPTGSGGVSGIFIPTSSYTDNINTCTPYMNNYAYGSLYFYSGPSNSPIINGTNADLLYPPTQVTNNGVVVSGSYFLQNVVDFTNNLYLMFEFLLSPRVGSITMRSRIYKNSYLISGADTDGLLTFNNSTNCTVGYRNARVYGTLCDGDVIKIILSRA